MKMLRKFLSKEKERFCQNLPNSELFSNSSEQIWNSALAFDRQLESSASRSPFAEQPYIAEKLYVLCGAHTSSLKVSDPDIQVQKLKFFDNIRKDIFEPNTLLLAAHTTGFGAFGLKDKLSAKTLMKLGEEIPAHAINEIMGALI